MSSENALIIWIILEIDRSFVLPLVVGSAAQET
jgi:hypothetical protein